ncbi:hypothetical protein K438DRAFT_1612962, partial [Mycena galopus ATCC 62051]
RHRTTQSCLNCHTSKRKCDRKRPCQRCVQLGLTGLCVYEIDDPALRDDPTVDENTRLRNRIAELESLVREVRGTCFCHLMIILYFLAHINTYFPLASFFFRQAGHIHDGPTATSKKAAPTTSARAPRPPLRLGTPSLILKAEVIPLITHWHHTLLEAAA